MQTERTERTAVTAYRGEKLQNRNTKVAFDDTVWFKSQRRGL